MVKRGQVSWFDKKGRIILKLRNMVLAQKLYKRVQQIQPFPFLEPKPNDQLSLLSYNMEG